MKDWRHTEACNACEASLVCVSGSFPRGTKVIHVARTDGRVLEKYSAYPDFSAVPRRKGAWDAFKDVPCIILGDCPRLSKIYHSISPQDDEPAMEVLL